MRVADLVAIVERARQMRRLAEYNQMLAARFFTEAEQSLDAALRALEWNEEIRRRLEATRPRPSHRSGD